MRARLLVTGPGEHVLVLVLHHIAADGWSLAPLARDLAAAYAARRDGGRRAGRRCRCSTPITRCGSGTCWGPRTTRAACWPGRSGTGGRPWRTRRPSWRCPRPGRGRPWRPTAGTPPRWRSRPGCTGTWPALARAHGVTLFMVVHAAVAVLLSRLGAGTDIPLGSPVAGRTDAALEDLVGFFVNTVVLRTDVSGDPAFAERAGPGPGAAPWTPSTTRTSRSSAWWRSWPRTGPWPATRCSRSCVALQNMRPPVAGPARGWRSPWCQAG